MFFKIPLLDSVVAKLKAVSAKAHPLGLTWVLSSENTPGRFVAAIPFPCRPWAWHYWQNDDTTPSPPPSVGFPSLGTTNHPA